MTIDACRRDILYRRGQKKIYLAGYNQKIHDFLKCCVVSPNLCSLEESDLIFNELINPYYLQEKREVKQPIDKLKDTLVTCKNKYSNLPFYIFIDSDWKYCGAFLLPSLYSVNENIKFCSFVKNDIYCISPQKILLHWDYWEYGNHRYFDFDEKKYLAPDIANEK